jgi:hypothetical protein
MPNLSKEEAVALARDIWPEFLLKQFLDFKAREPKTTKTMTVFRFYEPILGDQIYLHALTWNWGFPFSVTRESSEEFGGVTCVSFTADI